MNKEELYGAIRNFKREYISAEIEKIEKKGKTDEARGDYLDRIDSYRDEIQLLNIHGDKEKEAAYVRYIFEMASEEFL